MPISSRPRAYPTRNNAATDAAATVPMATETLTTAERSGCDWALMADVPSARFDGSPQPEKRQGRNHEERQRAKIHARSSRHHGAGHQRNQQHAPRAVLAGNNHRLQSGVLQSACVCRHAEIVECIAPGKYDLSLTRQNDRTLRRSLAMMPGRSDARLATTDGGFR